MPPGTLSSSAMIYPEFSEDEIRTNHLRDGQRECLFALDGDQLGRFAAIQEIGNPGGLTPADTEAIELIAGADKSQQAVSQLSNLFSKLRPITKASGETRQDFSWKRPPSGKAERMASARWSLLHVHAKIFKAILTNSSAASGPDPLCQALLDRLVGLELLVTEGDQGKDRVMNRLIAFAQARLPHSPPPTLRRRPLCPSAQERLFQPSFLPTPLMREIAAISLETTAALKTSTLMPLSIARASLGPTPETWLSKSRNRSRSAKVPKP